MLSYEQAILDYGSDKPDIRFDMKINYLDELTKGKGFGVFDNSQTVAAINVQNCADYSRKNWMS